MDRTFLAALALCCAGPMLLIVVLTSVVGFALGPAAAITIGVVAAGLCIAVMAPHHRHPRPADGSSPGALPRGDPDREPR